MPVDKPLVVYFIGAGFSRPLGLPLVSDFIETAKDLYFSKSGDADLYGSVLKRISDLSTVHNTFQSDLSNIEEVLSLVAMRDSCSPKSDIGGIEMDVATLQKFIASVLSERTPVGRLRAREPDPDIRPTRGNDLVWVMYVAFVESLLGLGYARDRDRALIPTARDLPTRYGVVSLNYDLVLERCAEHIQKLRSDVHLPTFARPDKGAARPGDVVLAKLHGSVDLPTNIVPMTMNKEFVQRALPAWQAAHSLLTEATEIRFIGYSLPPSDNHVRFLLKSAVGQNQRLRRIDVLALDPKGVVRRRFGRFLRFPRWRFFDGDVETYLENAGNQNEIGGQLSPTNFEHNQAQAWRIAERKTAVDRVSS